mmetsp:Transcript_17262/g.15572  ORF Transcript_17262/g.15572 Transcript_17262/m.15572 type:complete len:178 (-) Transcript_17262:106-639(-)
MKSFLILLIVLFIAIATKGFKIINNINHKSVRLYSLPPEAIVKLDEYKGKYDRLINVDSPEADSERAQLEDIVTKYNTYREVKLMMNKLKGMVKSEASDRRKERQFKSFLDLFRGKIELEEVLKEKLGLPFTKTPKAVEELNKLNQLNAEINSLKEKLESKSVKLAPGSSTRDARIA